MIALFVKSGKKEHLELLQKQGVLYMQSLKKYSAIEDENRKDELETVSNLQYLDPARYPTLILSVPEVPNDIHINLTYSRLLTHGHEGYAFCLHTIYFDEVENDVPFVFNLKGGYALMITNPSEFLRRVKAKAIELDYNVQSRKVEYKEFKYFSGERTVFQKDLLYKDEREYRIFFRMQTPTPDFQITIGSIEDISTICEAREGNCSFKLTSSGNSPAL